MGRVAHSLFACKQFAKRGRAFYMGNSTEERKKSFIMYHSHKAMFTESSPEQCQELIGRIFDFAETGVPAKDITDPLVKICYDQITYLMGRNIKKYAETCQKRSKAKKKWWDEKKTLEELEQKIESCEGDAKQQLKYIEEYRKREEELRKLEAECDPDEIPFK